MLVWRGFGIIVPIVFVLTGLLVSWISGDPDTRLGNPNFLGWTSLFSGIVILLLGLAVKGMDSKDEDGNPVKKKHDFFFIPVFIWGLILGGLSVYFLGFAGKAATDATATGDSDSIPVVADEAPSTRMVNFFNPTSDTLTYIIADETGEGLIEKKKVAPMSFNSVDLPTGDYMFATYKGTETVMSLPSAGTANDESKFVQHEDEKGKFHQRILKPMTKATDDYDEAWLVMDGKTQLLLVNVTTVCDPEVTADAVKEADWTGSIQEEYDPRDLVEPLYKKFLKDEMIKVTAPGEKLPTEIAENEVYYLLIPYKGEKDKNSVIVKNVLAARF